jgi:hypothetical protein
MLPERRPVTNVLDEGWGDAAEIMIWRLHQSHFCETTTSHLIDVLEVENFRIRMVHLSCTS